MADVKKIAIGNKMYDVVTLQKYNANPSVYNAAYTAIEQDGYAYPILNSTEFKKKNVPGVFNAGLLSVYCDPDEAHKEEYSMTNAIDLSNPANIKEIMDKSQMIKNLEHEILTNSDNITIAKIGEDDKPQMRGLKEFINAKQCDVNAYADRFGPNFPNDIRLIKEDDISFKKLVVYGNALDAKISVTFEDKNPNVPNPSNKKITVVITGGDQ